MTKRDWLVVLIVMPAFTMVLVYNGLGPSWFFFSPIAAAVYLVFRRARLAHSVLAILLNLVISVPVGYVLMFLLWMHVLCDPSHDWCQRS